MGLLLRMMQRQKWGNENISEIGTQRIPADAITTDLRTNSNELSVWFVENKDELNKGVLAIALGRNQITRLDVVIFEEEELVEQDLNMKNSPEHGMTALRGFSKHHYDLINLDYEKLGKLSELIGKKLTDEEKCIRFEKGQINEIIYEGYKENLINFEDLPEKLQPEFIKLIKKRETAC